MYSLHDHKFVYTVNSPQEPVDQYKYGCQGNRYTNYQWKVAQSDLMSYTDNSLDNKFLFLEYSIEGGAVLIIMRCE